MLLTIDGLKIDFLVVDVIELDVLGARDINQMIKLSVITLSCCCCTFIGTMKSDDINQLRGSGQTNCQKQLLDKMPKLI
jgi:hypothetical protein